MGAHKHKPPRKADPSAITTRKAAITRPLGTETAQRPPKLFIAVPKFAGLGYMEHEHGMQLLLRSLDASGVKHRIYPLGNESLITRARNKCVMEFLKSDCTDFLQVDADVGFLPKDVAMLMRSPFEVTCGAYPIKRIPWGAIWAAARAGVPAEELEAATSLYATGLTPDANGTLRCDILECEGNRFVEVQDAATGFLLIRRAAIERFVEHWKDQIRYVADYYPNEGETHYAVFSDGLDPLALKEGRPARWLSEDYMFSRMWQMLGGKIYLCIDVKLSHTGTYTWRGDVSRLFRDAPGGNVKPEAEAAAEAELPVEMVGT